jgi:hypothetical protein
MSMLTGHILYLAASLAVTVWVARTLSRHGRLFLVDIFGGRERVADAVNTLLVVGFYLVNVAYVALALKFGPDADTPAQVVFRLTDKMGLVLLILGGMHFFNLLVLTWLRRKSRREPLDVTEFVD